MDDVASEVGLSRPSVYRYFADRDDLLIELITRHARALLDRARKSVSRQSSLADQIVETVLYTADHGRRDPLTRHCIDPDGTSLGKRMVASGTTGMIRAEMWDPANWPPSAKRDPGRGCGPALADWGTPPYRGAARHLPIGTPHHLLLNHSRALGMAIDNRTAACTCSACAYRGSEGNGH
jgi:AcrR family transcriptional regulator